LIDLHHDIDNSHMRGFLQSIPKSRSWLLLDLSIQ